MARRFFIPFISFLAAAIMGYALQAHQPSRKDFIAWTAFTALIIGVIELILGMILRLTSYKKLAKEFLFTAFMLLMGGGGIVAYIYANGDFEKMRL